MKYFERNCDLLKASWFPVYRKSNLIRYTFLKAQVEHDLKVIIHVFEKV